MRSLVLLAIGLLGISSISPRMTAAQVSDVAVPGDHSVVFAADFSPDSSLLATGGNRLRVYRTADGTRAMTASVPKWIRVVAFSPVSSEVFATLGHGGPVLIWKIGQAEPQLTLRPPGRHGMAVAYSPDGRLLACASNGITARQPTGYITVWDSETGKVVHSQTKPVATVDGVTFSPDGTRLAFAENREQSAVHVIDIEDWTSIRQVPYQSGRAHRLAITPDGNRLLIVGGECIPTSNRSCQPIGRIWSADLQNDKAANLIKVEACDDDFRSLSMAYDAGVFATGTTSTVTLYDNNRRPFEQRVIGVVQLRNIADASLVWSRKTDIGHPYGVDISPDQRFVSACCDKSITLINFKSGEIERVIAVTD